MTAFQLVKMIFPAQHDDEVVSRFELVFSEFLDSEASSYWRAVDGKWHIEALFTSLPNASLIDQMLAPLYEQEQIESVPVFISKLEMRDWLAENRAAFPALHIGRLWVHGSHVTTPCPVASTPLLIDASLAFGSGTHPTTEGCLRAIQMIRHGAPHHVLDLGCGSAILAIAAARLWPTSFVVATDNDPVAVRVAVKNRKLNKIAPARMRLATSQGFSSRLVCNHAPYDLILANILAGPLTRMASKLVPRLHAEGWLVLSGILLRQKEKVESAYRAQNMRVWRRICLGEWVTIILRHGGVGTMPQLWGGR